MFALAGCGNDIMTPEVHPDDTSSPDEDVRLVSFSVGVASENHQDGTSPGTRSDRQSPIRFVHDLGGGYALESTMTVAPKKRANQTRAALPSGTTILMVAFQEGDVDPVGYQLLTVSEENTMTVSLPKSEKPYNIAFHSMRDDRYDPDKFDPQSFFDFPDGSSSEHLGENYYELIGVGLKGVAILTTEQGSPQEDLIYGLLPDIDPSAKQRLTVKFRHAFAELTWTLNVNPAYETIGSVDVGLYPRHGNALVDLTSFATASSLDDALAWTSDADGEQYLDAEHAGSLIVSQESDQGAEFQATTSFIPALPHFDGIEDLSAALHLNTLEIVNTAVKKTVKGVSLPLTLDGTPIACQPGMSYNISSKLTKRITWAASNIYYKDGDLTFDPIPKDHDGDGVTDSEQIQGLYFKWGSLIGISAPTSESESSFNSSTIYTPKRKADGTNQGYDKTAVSATNRSYNDIAPNILGTDPFTLPDDGNGTYRNEQISYNNSQGTVLTGENQPNWFGDICAYISGGGWRMPTSTEINPLGGNQFNWNTSPANIGWYSPSPKQQWEIVVVPKDANSIAEGRGLVTSSKTYGAYLTTNAGETSLFATSRHYTAVGNYTSTVCGMYFSNGSETSSQCHGVYYIYSMVLLDGQTPKAGAAPVRCIKN
jgi:hypothetical protein